MYFSKADIVVTITFYLIRRSFVYKCFAYYKVKYI